MFRHIVAALAASPFIIGTAAQAAPITDASFFTGADTLIDFESVPGTTGVPTSGSALSDQFASLGVRFSSEATPNVSQATDPADTAGRFDGDMVVLAAVSGGGAPTSGVRYASGAQFVNQSGRNVSDMRIDFSIPVVAVGMQVIDNDFSTARLTAFDATGAVLESIIIPEVSEGGVAYHGIDGTKFGAAIAYLILDGNGGAMLDSTLIDDLSFRVQPVPLPGAALLFLAGAPLLVIRRLRRR